VMPETASQTNGGCHDGEGHKDAHCVSLLAGQS